MRTQSEALAKLCGTHFQAKLRNTPIEMSLGLNGAFWPTILPLFQGSR